MILRSPLIVGIFVLLAAALATPADMLARLENRSTAGWAMSMRLEPDTVNTGDHLALEVTTDRAGYLTVLQRGTDHALDVVFPNALDTDTHRA